jgi:predicted negative regulator of RcsB-dependent stress response
MAHYDLEEQEQIDTIKTWWKMYGNLVTSVVSRLRLAVIGWQGWNWYQRGQSTAQAAAIYGVLEQAVSACVMHKRSRRQPVSWLRKFGGTNYAGAGCAAGGQAVVRRG